MSENQTVLSVNRNELVGAWQRILPEMLNESDECNIILDQADPDCLRITIETAGHSKYSFDFKCTYMDEREVKVELVDVEQDGVHVDERQEIIQSLIEDYVRHIHECAQSVQQLTNA
ncbi:hypothetical protein [Marinicrinis lubricantis]|uniref:Uncharacterized protein n=1 Tax=Marinicrinis lubricantis TaxID=2086470 RepID=A0ABW1IK80_9BACL